ncbi:helicase associated domain-containing protein [Arthrobacter agilis]|uniref:helicase associated domain-containing protein n=1 Tax=Arthrobacter agilis TaxID=37921 RepID=UPI002365AC7D|nr:helicase associated domain-containing protein [Arthrobacter agilis]WDF34526.1 helicase associated domain-containing protein [Arthrobacter agilis]
MYERGLSLARIATLCRVPRRAVRRAIERADRRDPQFFNRRLAVHDQPALPRVRPSLTWDQKYRNLLWFVQTTGRMPRQHGSKWERQCHWFLYKVRHQHHAGQLTTDQLESLEAVDGWYLQPRESDHWEQRFTLYLRFVEDHGRRPSAGRPKGTEERSLAIWIWSQRKRLKSGTMPVSRAEELDRAVPGWRGQSDRPGR